MVCISSVGSSRDSAVSRFGGVESPGALTVPSPGTPAPSVTSVPSSAASAEKRCKWCKRSSLSANPLPYTGHVCLPWRRKVGSECAICPYVLSANGILEKRGMARETYAELLRVDAEEYKTFMSLVADYEKNENPDWGEEGRPATTCDGH